MIPYRAVASGPHSKRIHDFLPVKMTHLCICSNNTLHSLLDMQAEACDRCRSLPNPDWAEACACASWFLVHCFIAWVFLHLRPGPMTQALRQLSRLLPHETTPLWDTILPMTLSGCGISMRHASAIEAHGPSMGISMHQASKLHGHEAGGHA